MMYRHHTDQHDSSHTSGRRWIRLAVVAGVAVGVALFLSARILRSAEQEAGDGDSAAAGWHALDWSAQTGAADEAGVMRRRLKRTAVPHPDFRNNTYREIFNDSNYVQLATARRLGVNPHTLGDPEQSKELVRLYSTPMYHIDTMYHARPYLIPEATLLLYYIGERFQELMEEHYQDGSTYKVIVTSALRTEESERKLRRVNRNATDTSCHMYGTTFDISAQRYRHESGVDTVVDRCKEMLATALYELRYEGLCYVKYERGSCFHITLRTTQYGGDKNWEMRRYENPGSPKRLQQPPVKPKKEVKPAPVPDKPKTQPQPKVEEKKGRAVKETPKKQKKAPPTATPKKEPQKPAAEKPAPVRQQPAITERERLSLEQYERRY